jgi:RNA:NAD 2'-phosphotransferase (TPT1/KptA family)
MILTTITTKTVKKQYEIDVPTIEAAIRAYLGFGSDVRIDFVCNNQGPWLEHATATCEFMDTSQYTEELVR